MEICRHSAGYQFVFAFLLLKTNIGITVIGGIANGFSYLLAKAADGVNFVFGGFKYVDPKNPPFFFSVLLPIVLSQLLSGFYNILKSCRW